MSTKPLYRHDDTHIAYVDESYVSAGQFYFVGAAIGTQEQWDLVDARLDELRANYLTRFGTAADIEFHAYDISSGRKGWRCIRGRHRDAVTVLASVLEAAHDSGIHYIVRGVDANRLNARYKYPEPPHLVAFRHVLERIDTFSAQRRLEKEVIVVADQHPEERRWKASIDAYRNSGTGGYRSSELRRISDPITFAESRYVGGLQVADTATYLRRRIEEIPDPGAAEARSRRKLVALLRDRTIASGVWRP